MDNEEISGSQNLGVDSPVTAKPTSHLKNYVLLLVITGAVVALDQWTKWWVRTHVPENGSWQPQWLASLDWPARIVHWYNTGAAFGIFQGRNPVFIALALLVIAIILYYYPRLSEGEAVMPVVVGLYLGGVIGNLIDRVMLGKVTDFISIGTFAVFNVADSSINVAVALLLLNVLLKERRDKRKASESS